ncbi:ATP-binding protein [Phaeovulum sp. W22_SRMD_FR3]
MAAAISGMSLYTHAINTQLDRLRAAQSDNTTWIISQMEVDYLRFQHAVELAISYPPDPDKIEDPRLDDVRRTYDILYSRISVISGGNYTHAVHPMSDLTDIWAELREALLSNTPLIDSANPVLRAGLPQMYAHNSALDQKIRDFVVSALLVQIDHAAIEREQIRSLLGRFWGLAMVLILILAGITWTLVRLYRDLRLRTAATERAISNLTTTIESSLDAVIVADAAGLVTQYNSAARKIFGYSETEALGQSLWTLFMPERFRDEHKRGMARFMRTGTGSLTNRGRVLLTAMRKDGTEFPVEAAIVSDRNSEGSLIFIGFVRDVSDRLRIENTLKQARDRALRSEQAKSRFLAVMSHEMRTPLNGVVAALDVIERTTQMSSRQRRFLSIAQSCSATALEQIGDVLELTRLDSGMPLEPEVRFDIVALMSEIVKQGRPLARAKGNDLALRLPDSAVGQIPSQVVGMKRLLGRALFNLMGNALKFTEGGRITISATLAERQENDLILRIEVADTGIGIPPDQQERIFENFETMDDTFTRTAQGTGLGLGIARRAVEAMGGRIGVESEPGKGSTFWFTCHFQAAVLAGAEVNVAAVVPEELDDEAPELAIPGLPAPEKALERPLVAPVRALSVLIAEDNPINRLVLDEMMRRMGHMTQLAENGRIAMEMAGVTAFDLILMDISMPEMDGLEATRRIRAGGASHRAWIVGVTAHAMDGDLAEYAAHGFDEMMPKPVTFDRLDAMLLRRSTTNPEPARSGPAADGSAPSAADEMEENDFGDPIVPATASGIAGINLEISCLIDDLHAEQTASAASPATLSPAQGGGDGAAPSASAGTLPVAGAEAAADPHVSVSVTAPQPVMIDEVLPMNSASPVQQTDADFPPLAATVPASNVLDTQVLNEAMDLLGPERFLEMTNRFRDEARGTMEGLARRLNEALPTQGAEIAGELHRLAGAAALFGGVTLSRRLAAAEDVLRRDGPAYLIPDLPSLTSAWRALDWALVAVGDPGDATPSAPAAAPRKAGTGL